MSPRTLQPSGLALVVVPSVLSTVIVLIRMWRAVSNRRFAVEDALLLLAQVLIFVLMITTWRTYRVSWYGYHYYDIPKGAIDPILASKWNFVNAVIYNPILGLIKASFVLTLIKLRSPDRRIQTTLWAIFVINALFAIAAPLVCSLQCNPVARFWDKSIPGRCIDAPSYAYGTISVVLITDIMVVAMPTWILYNLQMARKKKFIIISFLSLGLAVTGIGAYRLYVFWYLYNGFRKNPDSGYSVRQGLSNLEVSLASIGACGGTVRWLVAFCFPYFRADDSKLSKSRRSDPPSLAPNQRQRTQISTNHTIEDTIEPSDNNRNLVYKPPVWKGASRQAQAHAAMQDTIEESDTDNKSEQKIIMTNTAEWDKVSRRSITPAKEPRAYERRHKPRDVV